MHITEFIDHELDDHFSSEAACLRFLGISRTGGNALPGLFERSPGR